MNEISKTKNLNKTPLHLAVEKCETEIVQLLLLRPELDVNIKAISIKIVHIISIHKFEWHSKLNVLIKFKIIFFSYNFN